MNLVFALVCLAIATAGCGHRETVRDKVAAAIDKNDAQLLRQIVATNKTVLNETDGFDGSTLLHRVLARAYVTAPTLELAQILIASGIDVNKADVSGRSPLHVVCEFSSDPKAISLLLTNGASINIRDKSGSTALIYAKRNGRSQEAIALLKTHGATE